MALLRSIAHNGHRSVQPAPAIRGANALAKRVGLGGRGPVVELQVCPPPAAHFSSLPGARYRDVKPCPKCGKLHYRMPKYAIIDCEDEPKWDDEGPDDLWIRQLYEAAENDRPAEQWVTFRAYKGEIPTRADNLDGVLIPGSHYSVYENKPWMQDLKEYVRTCCVPWTANWADPQHSWKPMIVGSCFGHQLIAEAMGGHVCPNPRGKYIVKAEELYPTEAFCRMPWASSIVLKTKEGPMIQTNEINWSRNVETGALPFMRITETHGDSVVTLPADAQVLAVSDSSTNELFLVGRNLLAFQSHPEFTWENQLLTKVIPYVYPERMDDSERMEADESFSKPLHSDALIEITRRFLKGDYFERPKPSQLPGELYTCEADAEASRYNVPEGYPEELVGGMTAEEEEDTAAAIAEGSLPTASRYPGSAYQEPDGEPPASVMRGEHGFTPSGGGTQQHQQQQQQRADLLQPSPVGLVHIHASSGFSSSHGGQTTGEANNAAGVGAGGSAAGGGGSGRGIHTSARWSGGGAGYDAMSGDHSPAQRKGIHALEPDDEAVADEGIGGTSGMLWSLLERVGLVTSPNPASSSGASPRRGRSPGAAGAAAGDSTGQQ